MWLLHLQYSSAISNNEGTHCLHTFPIAQALSNFECASCLSDLCVHRRISLEMREWTRAIDLPPSLPWKHFRVHRITQIGKSTYPVHMLSFSPPSILCRSFSSHWSGFNCGLWIKENWTSAFTKINFDLSTSAFLLLSILLIFCRNLLDCRSCRWRNA